MLIFTVYDKKACVHTNPFFADRHEGAIRSFARAANDSRFDINAFPDDFSLYCVGEFNTDTGVVSGYPIVEHVIDARSLIKVVKNCES